MRVAPSSRDARLCVATVTTDSFLAGTLVTLHSFLKHHPWFTGDIVVIHGALSADSRECLSRLHGRIRFVSVSPELQRRVEAIAAVLPEFASKQARFHSLEIFRLTGYDKVLFCDSDLLFRRSIRELFDMPHALIACGDGAYYQGRGRRWATGDGVLDDTFNAGLFMVDGGLLTADRRAGLVELVDIRTYYTLKTRLADQVILNVYFAGQQHLVDATYNYLLAHHESIHDRERVRLSDARVVHFNGPDKPWVAESVWRIALRAPALIAAYRSWYDGYVECVQQISLQPYTGHTSAAATREIAP